MTMNMFFPDYADPGDDQSIIQMTVEQSIWLAELGYNVWFTDHHFRGPWHSNTLQFAAYVAPQLPADRYIGFGVLSIPFYHPLRLVESMNLLDQLTQGRVLFGVGSGWPGVEPNALGIDADYHASGRAAEETLDVMQRLWTYRDGDPEYAFSVGSHRGRIVRRVMPAPFTKPHPILIRTASRESSLIRAAQMGWPAFFGIFGSDAREQMRIYRRALDDANHAPDVVENCLRWCSFDWLSTVVARTDEEAKEREAIAKAEQLAIRRRYSERYGALQGPVMKAAPGKSQAGTYVAGGDMSDTIAGSPETVAAKVQQLAEIGINHLHVRFLGEWAGETRHIAVDSAELFANEVMPRFGDLKLTLR